MWGLNVVIREVLYVGLAQFFAEWVSQSMGAWLSCPASAATRLQRGSTSAGEATIIAAHRFVTCFKKYT